MSGSEKRGARSLVTIAHMSDRGLDEDAALEVVQRFATAVFERQSFLSALLLFSDESRREWAHEWVVGELENINLGESNTVLSWSEKDEVVSSLHSFDTDHRLWDVYAAGTLSLWQQLWVRLPEALRGLGNIYLGRCRTPEEWRVMGAKTTITVGGPERTGPPSFWIWFEESESVLTIESING